MADTASHAMAVMAYVDTDAAAFAVVDTAADVGAVGESAASADAVVDVVALVVVAEAAPACLLDETVGYAQDLGAQETVAALQNGACGLERGGEARNRA